MDACRKVLVLPNHARDGCQSLVERVGQLLQRRSDGLGHGLDEANAGTVNLQAVIARVNQPINADPRPHIIERTTAEDRDDEPRASGQLDQHASLRRHQHHLLGVGNDRCQGAVEIRQYQHPLL